MTISKSPQNKILSVTLKSPTIKTGCKYKSLSIKNRSDKQSLKYGFNLPIPNPEESDFIIVREAKHKRIYKRSDQKSREEK